MKKIENMTGEELFTEIVRPLCEVEEMKKEMIGLQVQVAQLTNMVIDVLKVLNLEMRK
jgi:hypothetical protein